MFPRVFNRALPEFEKMWKPLPPALKPNHVIVTPLNLLMGYYEANPEFYLPNHLDQINTQFKTKEGFRTNHLKGMMKFVSFLERNEMKADFYFANSALLYRPANSGRVSAKTKEEFLEKIQKESPTDLSADRRRQLRQDLRGFLFDNIAFSEKDVFNFLQMALWLGYPFKQVQEEERHHAAVNALAAHPNASIFSLSPELWKLMPSKICYFGQINEQMEVMVLDFNEALKASGLTKDQFLEVVCLLLRSDQNDIAPELELLLKDKNVNVFQAMAEKYPKMNWRFFSKMKKSIQMPKKVTEDLYEASPIMEVEEFRRKMAELVPGLESDEASMGYLCRNFEGLLRRRERVKLRDTLVTGTMKPPNAPPGDKAPLGRFDFEKFGLKKATTLQSEVTPQAAPEPPAKGSFSKPITSSEKIDKPKAGPVFKKVKN